MSKHYKILVLTDLKDSPSTLLNNAVNLAKKVDGEIDLFSVQKFTDVVERESQLSAMRTLNEKYNAFEKDIKNTVEPISKACDIKINYQFSFGNVKDEIKNYISQQQPDVIVLGKKKKAFSVVGDRIANYVLKQHKGTVLIVPSKSTLEPNQELSLGLLQDSGDTVNNAFVKNLFEKNTQPLKSFKLVDGEMHSTTSNALFNSKVIEYVFDKSDNAISNLSNYLTKSNVNLLYFNKEETRSGNSSKSSSMFNAERLINNLNVSLLIA